MKGRMVSAKGLSILSGTHKVAEEGRRCQANDNIRLLFMQMSIVDFFPNLKMLCCSFLSAHSMSCLLAMHTAPLLKREFFYPSCEWPKVVSK